METSRTKVYLSLGSNIGDREQNLRSAIKMLENALDTPPAAISSIIETPAEGFESPNPFLNLCVRFDLEGGIGPMDLLKTCKRIERRLGRKTEGEVFDAEGRRVYRDRPIDIDILLFGDVNMDTPELTVPHPRMAERDFVLIPLKEIQENF